MNHMVFPFELVFQKSPVPTFNGENEHGMQNDRVYNDNFINAIQSFFLQFHRENEHDMENYRV